jgi:hypothetical protein
MTRPIPRAPSTSNPFRQPAPQVGPLLEEVEEAAPAPQYPTPPLDLPPAMSARHILENPGQWFTIAFQRPARRGAEGMIWFYHLLGPDATDAQTMAERARILVEATENRIFCPLRKRPDGTVEWLAIALGEMARRRWRPLANPRRRF